MKKIFINPFVILLCFIFVGCGNNVYDIDMVYITGGSFFMGSDDVVAEPDERPIHSVNVRDFYLSKCEVTQNLWQTVMRSNPSKHRGMNFPVECVSWDDCQFFIKKLNDITGKNYRLPTEAEWEYVASMSYRLIEKEGLKSYVWFLGSFDNKIHNVASQKVGSLMPDSFGIYDIIGNVNEWCADSYDSLSYQNGFFSESDEKVFRGGCFGNVEKYLRPSNRNHINRYTRHYSLGLRLAMDAIPQNR